MFRTAVRSGGISSRFRSCSANSNFVEVASTIGSPTFPKSLRRMSSLNENQFGGILRPISKSTTTERGNDDDNATTDYDFSLECLQTRMQQYVSAKLSSTPNDRRLVVAIAGGGVQFLSTLTSTPGASSVLMEGAVLYDRESYQRFVQLRKKLERDDKSMSSSDFKFVSEEAAAYTAEASLQRALDLAAVEATELVNKMNEQTEDIVRIPLLSACGVACTSALLTNTSNRPDRLSRAYIAVHGVSGQKISMYLQLALQQDPEKKRSRFEEELVVSHCILSCLEYADLTAEQIQTLGGKEDEINTSSGKNIVKLKEETENGDTVVISISESLNCIGSITDDVILRHAAERILSGEDQSVMLVLVPPSSGNNAYSFQPLSSSVLPPRSLVVPGSFNPPHKGHVELAKRAAATAGCASLWFEISITNADKPPLEASEVVDRLKVFLAMQNQGRDPSQEEISMPFQWGILLTNAPLFKQKVDLLAPLQSHADEEDPNLESSHLHFCIGTDTLVRLVDKKYYNNSEDEMLDVLMNQMPCHFVVGGRLEQKKAPGEAKFITGEEDVKKLPANLQKKFTLLQDFRIDVSSTELRKKMAEGGKS